MRAVARRARTVGAIVEQDGRRVVAVGDGAADDRDALRARRGPLEEAAVPAEDLLGLVPCQVAEASGGVDNGVVHEGRVRDAEALL